jgi:hypothetical protein
MQTYLIHRASLLSMAMLSFVPFMGAQTPAPEPEPTVVWSQPQSMLANAFASIRVGTQGVEFKLPNEDRRFLVRLNADEPRLSKADEVIVIGPGDRLMLSERHISTVVVGISGGDPHRYVVQVDINGRSFGNAFERQQSAFSVDAQTNAVIAIDEQAGVQLFANLGPLDRSPQ